MKWTTVSDYELALERAGLIFSRWKEAKRLDALDFWRVLRGEYNYYVTFQRTWKAAGVDKYGYVVISGVKTLEEAQQIAADAYDGYVAEVTVEYEFVPANYRHGEIKTHDFGDEEKREKVSLDQ